MQNERLRAALLQHGLTNEVLAEKIGVDAKSIERWITTGRTPHRKNRFKVAAELAVDEAILWPTHSPPTRSPRRVPTS